MTSLAHGPSGLEKSVWTESDFGRMGWHDVCVVAAAFPEADETGCSRVLLDIDYLVRWVDPVAPATHFSFWLAPATLVFEEVWAVSGAITHQALSIEAIRRLGTGREQGPTWHVDGQTFDLFLTTSAGFTMTVRRAPVLAGRQSLTLDERGGIAFDETPFDADPEDAR